MKINFDVFMKDYVLVIASGRTMHSLIEGIFACLEKENPLVELEKYLDMRGLLIKK